MEWSLNIEKILQYKEDFEKSYKCLNKTTYISNTTINKHSFILVETLNNIKQLIHLGEPIYNNSQKHEIVDIYKRILTKLNSLIDKHSLNITVPNCINKPIIFIMLEEEPIQELQTEHQNSNTMAQSVVEFLNTACKLIPEFDGKAENLQSFLDALTLVDSIKGVHDIQAVAIVKTKLKGTARNFVGNETTLQQIISKLKTTVKGESVEVLSAKLMNLKQKSKTANDYTKEVESLTKLLETAYISDGLSFELATKYSTQQAVKSITNNCSIDTVKLIMEAGSFNTMDEAVSKFINACTQHTGHTNTILFYQRKYGN
ncbi:uncharacterized protein LOC121404090 [Drosophila obscura]|uniref:uncharacterized protein LOC121404090 n=1 Tax=Drosophila obscura TaxID=7282 RepID=UPI001BB10982|nr:uncharacterized protein LOC121404090 [Drosophila obscura]